MKSSIKVNKSEYEVYQYMGGYFGICRIGSNGGSPVFGGDSANEDDYNEEYIRGKFESWNGELHYSGNEYLI